LRTDVPVTLLYGDAERFKQRVVSKLADAWLGEAADEYSRAIVHTDEVGIQGVLAELAAGSLLSPKRLVVVQNVAALSARKLKGALNEQEQLARALEKLGPGVAVVLVARRVESDRKRWGPPVGKVLLKAVRERGQVLELSTPKDEALTGWIQREMERLGKQTGAAAVEALVGRAGADADRLLSEMEKLAAYVGDRLEVSEEDVQAAAVSISEDNVFALVDAIGRRDAKAALAWLDGSLPEGSATGDALRVLGMVVRQLRLIWQARFVEQQGHSVARVKEAPAEITEKLPEHHSLADAVSGRQAWLASKYTAQARNFSDAQLARAMDRVYQADLALKGQSGEFDHRTVMELMIADLCG